MLPGIATIDTLRMLKHGFIATSYYVVSRDYLDLGFRLQNTLAQKPKTCSGSSSFLLSTVRAHSEKSQKIVSLLTCSDAAAATGGGAAAAATFIA